MHSLKEAEHNLALDVLVAVILAFAVVTVGFILFMYNLTTQ
jgi:hypothetical protein